MKAICFQRVATTEFSDTDMEDDKTRSEATFRYTVKNFSTLKNSALSPACYIRDLAWKIMVKPQLSQDRTTTFLGLFLQCNNENKCSSWSCNANMELRLLSVRPDVTTASKNFQRLWSSKDKNSGWGYSNFMAWIDVLDPMKGFIEDDSITVEAHVCADVPHVVPMEHFYLIEATQRNSLQDIKLLSINRTLINTIDDKGNAPLHYAIISGNIQIVEYLIKSKANVCKPGENGKTPLLIAVEYGNIDIIQLLLRQGADNTIQSAFLAAVTSQNLDIVKLLIEHGALLDVIYRDGHTALTKSLELKNFDVVKVLIEHGAKVNMPNGDGTSPLSLALKTGNSQICYYLINNNGKLATDSDQAFEYLPKYIEEDNFEMVQILLELGAKLEKIYECGETPLTKAVKVENFEIAEYLIKKGANVNQSNSDGEVPLAVAASNQDILIVKLLIQSKACLDLAKEEVEKFANSHEDFHIYWNMLNKSSDCFVNDTERNSLEDCGQEAASP